MAISTRPLWLVTGAAGALGSELVRQLAAGGADCVALDRNEAALNQLHDQIEAQGFPPPSLLPFDLAGAGPMHYDQVADRISQQYGRLDGLIHNAADFKALRPMAHQSPEEWMSILQAGVTAPQLLTSALMGLLQSTSGAKLVFISDEECLKHPANWAAYGVAQAARRWMVDALKREITGDRIEVMAVDPGAFYSPLRVKAWPVAQPGDFDPIEVVAGRVLKIIKEGEAENV
jgi:NAD(P)-dependent dehydrogenase (short-subunit alcohol dehydrogenase family)